MNIEAILSRMSPEQKEQAKFDKVFTHRPSVFDYEGMSNSSLVYMLFLDTVAVEELEGKDVLRNNDSPGGF